MWRLGCGTPINSAEFRISAAGGETRPLKFGRNPSSQPSQCRGSIARIVIQFKIAQDEATPSFSKKQSHNLAKRLWSIYIFCFCIDRILFTTQAIIYAGHWYTTQSLSAASTYPQNLNVLANPFSLKNIYEYKSIVNKFEGKNALFLN